MKKIFLAAACAFFIAVPAALAQTNDTIQAAIDLDAKYATNMLKPGTKAPEFTLRTYDEGYQAEPVPRKLCCFRLLGELVPRLSA